MADLIPWAFILPPVLVTLAALVSLMWRRTPAGRAKRLLTRGGQHLYQQELDKAEGCFREALKLRPEDPAIAGTLASLLVGRERYEEALPLLEKALAKASDDHRLRLVLGKALLATGKRDEAVEEWSKLPAESDVYLDARGQLAALAEKEGDLEGALAHVDAALSAGTVHERRPFKKEKRRLESLVEKAAAAATTEAAGDIDEHEDGPPQPDEDAASAEEPD